MSEREGDGKHSRRLPVGAEAMAGGGVHFRVWAPERRHVRVVLNGAERVDLQHDAGGYFAAGVKQAGDGTSYKFEFDDSTDQFPDPASRFQPDGPHGGSRVVDPALFRWTDEAWKGISAQSKIVYEMHLGTFTKEGTWAAARLQLPELASIGISVIELMPINDFPGRFGWGYDGVGLFAPVAIYGDPDDAKRFIDEAHRLGIGVILDVVYNHFGPDGNYLAQFSREYFTDKYENDWGEAVNFSSAGVRDFFLANARYWIEEYHFDGLRLDATQDIHDKSEDHILAAISRQVRAAANGRETFIVAENEPQETKLTRDFGIDALWNDDWHHSALVALTGHSEAYYTDYKGSPQELVSASKYGYLYQGQWYEWQKQRRGTGALDLAPWNFVTFTQNHDQVANTARGLRPNLLSSPAKYRAVTALLLLSPGTPMLFQGQEFGATTPFLYFCDHQAELCRNVAQGRKKFLGQFPSLATSRMQAVLAAPDDDSTFERSKLDFAEREKNAPVYSLYKDLLQLRRSDAVFHSPRRRGVDGAVLSAEAFVLRYFGGDDGDRLLIVNLGRDLHLHPAPEPLLAPPAGRRWKLLWSSEDPRYDGNGTVEPDTERNWLIAANSAIVMTPGPAKKEKKKK